jgi:hypothetical protein
MDPDSRITSLCGGEDLRPTDVVGKLPRHPKKKYKIRDESLIDMIVLHCTDRNWTIQQLAEYDVEGELTYDLKIPHKGFPWTVTEKNHISRSGLPAITYHDCIKENKIYHTLPYDEVSWHASGYNTRSLAVAMMYRTTNPGTNRAEYAPRESMLKLTQCHLAELCLRFRLAPNRIFGHRELKGTGWDWIRGRKRLLKSCPGPHVDLDLIRTNATKYMQIHLALIQLYIGKIDGQWGPKSQTALNMYRGRPIV